MAEQHASVPVEMEAAQRRLAPPFGVRVRAAELRHQMQQRGLTGAELARRARVAEATISHALNGRRIHPAKLRAIAGALLQLEPLPGAEALVEDEGSARGGHAGDG